LIKVAHFSISGFTVVVIQEIWLRQPKSAIAPHSLKVKPKPWLRSRDYAVLQNHQTAKKTCRLLSVSLE
jgi:hypothetical protein